MWCPVFSVNGGMFNQASKFFLFIFGLGGPLKCLSNWYIYLMCVDGVGNGVHKHKRQLQFPSQNQLRASEAMVRGDQVQASIPCHTMPYVPNTHVWLPYHSMVNPHMRQPESLLRGWSPLHSTMVMRTTAAVALVSTHCKQCPAPVVSGLWYANQV